MTEAEWLACTDPQRMLEFLRSKASDRKLRLFAAASFRHLSSLLPDSRQHRGIELMEQIAERAVTMDTRRKLTTEVRHALPLYSSAGTTTDDPYFVALMLYRELLSSSVAVHAVSATAGLAEAAAERL